MCSYTKRCTIANVIIPRGKHYIPLASQYFTDWSIGALPGKNDVLACATWYRWVDLLFLYSSVCDCILHMYDASKLVW